MPSPFTHSTEEIFYGFLFWPEVAEEIVRITWKHHALLSDQLFDPRVSLPNVLLRS